MSPINHNVDTLTRRQGMAYGLPMLSFTFLTAPSSSILQGIYAKHFGMALTTIAAVLLIARLFDAVTDPLIGYYTDRYYARRGTYRPFILAGALLFVISSWFLYVPYGVDPSQSDASVSTVYFLVWFLAFYLTQTLFEIPQMAWGGELARSSREKNTIYSLRSLFAFFGILLFYAVPLLPWFETTEFTPQTLQWTVLVAGALMLLTLFLCFKHVPSRTISSPPIDTGRQGREQALDVVLRAVFKNRAFLLLSAAHICTGIGSGMWFALLYIFTDTYLKLGSQFALVFVICTCLKIVFLKVWFVMANRLGKQIAWIGGMVLVVLGIAGTGLLSPEKTDFFEFLLCVALVFSGFSAFSVMVPSLLSDIVDYGTWKFGSDRGATYFSLYCFSNKAIGALGAALSLAIAGGFGFEPTANSHSVLAVTGMHLGMVWIPVLFFVLSIVFIARIPITTHRHTIIRRRLDQRLNRGTKSTSPRDETSSSGNQSDRSKHSNSLLQT